MKTTILTLLSIAILCLTSCEDVIEIKPSDIKSQYAVEGFVLDQLNESYIRLSQTTPYFSQPFSLPVSAARVLVFDDQNTSYEFIEGEKGIYKCPEGFKGIQGVTYSLNIEIGDHFISASSTMPKIIMIDSIRYEFIASGDPNFEEGYYLYGMLSDDPEVTNYFFSEVKVNGKKQIARAEDIIVFDDRFFDKSQNVEGQFWYWGNKDDDYHKINIGDEVSLQLYSIDYDSYNFLKALSETSQHGGLFGKNPANVPSNIDGALGLFQASAVSLSKTIKIQ
ncbi:MAG: DUF4249 domain-containing protein [Fulvivirga sp.]|uniref:DUF4249 domain-containing protein n=1 Tax=Fulvivirga sp. TaxID=1931237 RepID=UPI0032ECFCAB